MAGVLRDVTAVRYVTPLRAGGSVPGVVEADDLGTYVVKFTGSAQGRKALVAEVIVGELARALGLRFPELVLVHFDPAVAAHEPHQEVQDLLRASAGLNLGMDYLSGREGLHPGGRRRRSPSTRWRRARSSGWTPSRSTWTARCTART